MLTAHRLTTNLADPLGGQRGHQVMAADDPDQAALLHDRNPADTPADQKVSDIVGSAVHGHADHRRRHQVTRHCTRLRQQVVLADKSQQRACLIDYGYGAYRCRVKVSATCCLDASARTVITGEVMMSPAVTCASDAAVLSCGYTFAEYASRAAESTHRRET